MNKKRNRSTEKTRDDAYVNTQNWHPLNQTYPEISDRIEVLINKKTGKVFISALVIILMVGALSTICVVRILYHNKVVSYELLSEQYANITATLVMEGNKANETERLYEALKRNYQQVQKELSACNANQNSRECKEGWKSYGLKCYYFSIEKLDWAQSRDYCVEKGGHLVIITSQPEQNFASSQIGESHWIGLNDLETEGKWMWVNNQPLTEMSIKFWYISPELVSEPDNWKKEDPSGENCAALGHEAGYFHKWFDASCRKLKHFICQM